VVLDPTARGARIPSCPNPKSNPDPSSPTLVVISRCGSFRSTLTGTNARAIAKLQAMLGAAIVAALPAAGNHRFQLLAARATAEGRAEIDPARCVEAQIPHAVGVSRLRSQLRQNGAWWTDDAEHRPVGSVKRWAGAALYSMIGSIAP